MEIKSVLIIDDNEGDQLLTQWVVEDYDASISIYKAFDGQEALNLLKEMDLEPNIIFLDINMPGMNGHEFLEEFHRLDYSSTVVTMLTSSDQEMDKENSLKYPFVKKYIVKPITLSDLESIIEAISH